MWVARDKNGQLWLYEEKPYKARGCNYWNSDSPAAKSMIMKDDLWRSLSSVKWEDKEPTEIKLIKK